MSFSQNSLFVRDTFISDPVLYILTKKQDMKTIFLHNAIT